MGKEGLLNQNVKSRNKEFFLQKECMFRLPNNFNLCIMKDSINKIKRLKGLNL